MTPGEIKKLLNLLKREISKQNRLGNFERVQELKAKKQALKIKLRNYWVEKTYGAKKILT